MKRLTTSFFVMVTLVGVGPRSLLAADAANPASVTVLTASGQRVTGTMTRLGDRELVVGGQRWGWDDLAKLTFDNAPQSGPTTRVQLRSGSSVAVGAASLADGQEQLLIEPRLQDSLAVSLRELASIRFRPGTATTDPVWLGLIEEGSRVDRLVARRDDQLEPIEGTVAAMGRESVSFELQGTSVEAPLAKLEGVILASASSNAAVTASLVVRDVWGSVWQATQLSLSEDASGVALTIGESLRHVIPLSQLIEIEFQGGILTLATAEVATSSVRPGRGFSGDAIPLSDWFGPRVDGEFISMQGPGEIVFRVPPGYSRLVGGVRRARDVDQFGEARVVIQLDEEAVWQMPLDDRGTLGFDVPLGKSRRLTLRLESPDDSTLGDCVDWINGRLLK